MEEVKKGLKISDELIKNIKDYYNKGNSASITAKYFNISKSTVIKYVSTRKKSREPIELRKEKNIEHVKWFRKRLKIKAVEYKGGCCEKCGYNKTISALEFHHKNPKEKDFSPSGLSISWERMKNEIDKCILVCANCHREIHDEINKLSRGQVG